MDMLNLYAEEYDAHNWNEFVKCFNEIDVEIEGLPQDIVNVVLNLLGHEMGYKWLNEEVFESIDEEDNLKGIYNSIKERNQESFDLFMKNRIKEIRRLSEGYLVVVDFWALSLIKYASEKGMENNIRVVELGYTEYGDNVFL